MLLGTLALAGMIRAILIYLSKKVDGRNRWKSANLATVFLRTLCAVPRLIGTPFLSGSIAAIFVVYLLQQQVWFVYDYVQQRRQERPAGWKLIFGTIVGGLVWLLAVDFLVAFAGQILIAVQ